MFNTPYSDTCSMVGLALGETIIMARRLGDKNISMYVGIWDKPVSGPHEVRGRTFRVIGYGNVGSQLPMLAERPSMKVYFYGIADHLVLGNVTRVCSLQELFELCETTTIYMDGRAPNAHMIGEREFSQMRSRTLFLNLYWGNVVDTGTLATALKSGRIASAAADVFPSEPENGEELLVSPLWDTPSVIPALHVGGPT